MGLWVCFVGVVAQGNRYLLLVLVVLQHSGLLLDWGLLLHREVLVVVECVAVHLVVLGDLQEV